MNDDVPGLPARHSALRMLDAVLRRGEPLDQAAHNATQSLPATADRALARALAAEALRWLIDIDALIDSATRQALPDDSKPRAVLRLMLAGWLRLETPPHAVIATGLPLLSGGPRRLAHGVFSTLVKRAATLPVMPTLPSAVAARWGERATQIAEALILPPPLDLSLRDPGETALWSQRLGGVSLLPGHLRLPRGQSVETLTGFAEGAWWVQDIAASLPARILGQGNGRSVLDLCAAPGGKTLQLAAAGWQVTALDISPKRLERLRENLTRTNLPADIVVADLMKWEPAAPFDAVMLDAPCTATGTCRRHPDVLHRIGSRQIAEMAEVQGRMLDRAATWVKSGGQLVYAVCSLEQEEGEAQAARIKLPPIQIDLPGFATTPVGWLRTDPGLRLADGGMDGFFVGAWRS